MSPHSFGSLIVNRRWPGGPKAITPERCGQISARVPAQIQQSDVKVLLALPSSPET